MCNLLWLCACLLLLLLPLALAADGSKVNVTDAHTQTQAAPLQLPLGSTNNTSNPLPLPLAEKLVRYRRQHGKRGKRRRVKNSGPKTKYGPPSYPPGPPISYYKPELPAPLPSFPTHLDEPSFSIEDFQHLKFDGTDFHIPASSYEAQSMDLNLYSHEESDNDLYGAHKFPSLEYSFTGPESLPLPSHPAHSSSSSGSSSYTPHQKYGVPPLPPTNSYETPDTYASHNYGPPPQSPPSAPSVPPSTHYGVPSDPLSTHYGVPSAPAHVPSFTHPGPPPAPDSYSIYEQKIPNVGYHHNFAEPPPPAPPAHNSNYEIAYSPPAYEISTSFHANEQEYEHKYAPPSSSHDGHFAEPPAPAPPPQYTPHHPAQHLPPQHLPPPQHYPPAQHPPQDSPPHHSPPSPPQHSPPYHPPPPQHSPPHPPSYAPPDTHPPSSYDPPASYDPPSSYEPIDTDLPSSYTNVELHPNYPNENYSPPSEELPLNPNHKFHGFDFPKSSYEVPIYDPIPFEASSSNKEEQEYYPPNLPDSSSNDLPTDAHASGSSQSPAKSRKRKRRPSSAVISKKHTLDVPELQEAYDADSHVHVRGTDSDTAAHGSRHVEQKRKYVNYAIATTTTTTPAPWSPMRVRTTASGGFIPTVLTSTPLSQTTSRSRNRGTSRYRSRSPISSPNPSTETSSTAVTIQKSRSQSYYDGTLAPPTYQQFPVQTGRSPRPTRPANGRGGGGGAGLGATLALQPGTERYPTLQRTTKGVFDTTLFKSPLSDRELERKLHALRQNLPKNHKLY